MILLRHGVIKNVHTLILKRTVIWYLNITGVTIPSCYDSIHITILNSQYDYCNTSKHDKRLTKNVLLIKLLTLILHCGFKWTGLDSVLVTQGQWWHKNKNIHDSEAEITELLRW